MAEEEKAVVISPCSGSESIDETSSTAKHCMEHDGAANDEKPTQQAKRPCLLGNNEIESEEETSNVATALRDLRSGLDRSVVYIVPIHYNQYGQGGSSMRRCLVDWSILRAKLEEGIATTTKTTTTTSTIPSRVGDWKSLIDKAISMDHELDRAVGCFLGMVVGDSVGAPLEFTPASSQPLEERDSKEWGHSFVKFTSTGDNSGGKLEYVNEKNSFRLERGQWTDDASMGICMAESLLARGGYHGGDVRVRFHLWWFFGYCNAFRHDTKREGSVGLGGNISQSLQNLVQKYNNNKADDVPPRYEASGEDAGNGSLMRLAPVPIRYHNNVEVAMNMAEESSYTTHPGPDAAHCCRFVAFFICQAIHRPKDDPTDIATFTNQAISEFLSKNHTDNPKVQALLQSKPPSSKEACWNWQADRLAIEETLTNRGINYNGYPVSAEYFGSYCMDGLAMALWAATHSNSLTDCILRTVNLQGDADTTASIAGQLAGSFYGYQKSLQNNNDPCGQQMIQDIRQWDPLYELELRAILLHGDAEGIE